MELPCGPADKPRADTYFANSRVCARLGDRRTSGGRNILSRERFRPENQTVGHSECFFDFGFEPDRREAAACRHLSANAVAEDDCPGDVIQRQNATTPNRATVPHELGPYPSREQPPQF